MGLGYLLSLRHHALRRAGRPGRRGREAKKAAGRDPRSPKTPCSPAPSAARRTRSPGPSRRSSRRPTIEHREENYWMMSQRAATLSYHIFGAGFSLVVYALFYVACDIWGWQLGLFRTLGTNALVGYILHGMVGDARRSLHAQDSPGWYVTAALPALLRHHLPVHPPPGKEQHLLEAVDGRRSVPRCGTGFAWLCQCRSAKKWCSCLSRVHTGKASGTRPGSGAG